MGKSAIPHLPRMTADDFLAWAVDQPKRPRYELVAGELVMMAPERAAHALIKARIWLALHQAAGLKCAAYPDGMAVRTDDDTVYEPDALTHWDELLIRTSAADVRARAVCDIGDSWASCFERPHPSSQTRPCRSPSRSVLPESTVPTVWNTAGRFRSS